jgi:hypothetical protein
MPVSFNRAQNRWLAGGGGRMPARPRAANRVGSAAAQRGPACEKAGATKNHEKSSGMVKPDNTLRASFWRQFLHWNNSRLEKTYCNRGF